MDDAADAVQAPAEGDRRQLTVLFADLVGSTELAARLDPEDLRDVLHAFQDICATVVGGFEGHIAQYLGDGVVAYFGYPQAHEDSALRAVRSALGLAEAMHGLNSRLEREKGVRLAVRMGIDTGLVVTGEMGAGGKREQLALGETMNVAARLQSLGEPDSALISAATHHLVAGYFDFEERGPHTLKGVPNPVVVYRVLSESTARTRLDVAAARGLTPLAGRDAEVGRLLARWRAVEEGEGQAVLLCGEAGIGKSRLVRVLEEHVAQRPGAWLTPCQCSPYYKSTALYPVIDLLERIVLQYAADESPAQKLHKLEGWLLQCGFVLEDTVPLFARLLSLPLDGRYEPLPLAPERQKQLTLEALTSVLVSRALEQPVLFVIEDVHWADPTTLELLGLVLESVRQGRMLILLTYRPDFRPPWVLGPGVTQVALDRLDGEQATAMAATVAGLRALAPEVRAQIVARAEGIPLFLEELTKAVLESSLVEAASDQGPAGTRPRVVIPATLQDSLMARLDRLGSAKSLAQLCSAIGREFPYDLLRSVSNATEQTLRRDLGSLVEAELLYVRGEPPKAFYTIKHALIEEAAYESMLRTTRREYHRRIARALEERFPATAESQPELLAHHTSGADLHEEAIVYWQRAAQRAIERSANEEATTYLARALELVEQLPEGLDRSHQELELYVTLGVPLIALKGYAAADVERTFAQARELSLRVGETPQLPNILWGLWVFYLTGGPLPSALEMADQYRAVAELHPEDSGLQLETCQLSGIGRFYQGEFIQALPELERGSRLYDPAEHHALIFAHGGADTGVALMTHEGLALWALGDPARAQASMQAALDCAKNLSHPFSLAFAHYFYTWFHKLCRDEPSALTSATAAIEICDEFGFPFWGLLSSVLEGSTLVEQDKAEKGVRQMEESLAAYEATGGLLYRSALRGLLAEAYRATGQAEEGLRVLSDALAGLEGREERWWEPELHRLRGELLMLWRDADAGEVEAAFQQALEVSRRQGATSWELRAATSLGRFWRDRGQAQSARRLLSEAYGKVGQGLETGDLREARTLLAEL